MSPHDLADRNYVAPAEAPWRHAGRRRIFPIHALITPIGYLSSIICLMRDWQVLAMISIIVAVVGELFGVAITNSARRKARRTNSLSLLESEPSATNMAVEIGDRPNNDFGAMAIEADHIIFVGARTSFVIGGQDIRPPAQRWQLRSKYTKAPFLCIPLRDGNRQLVVTLIESPDISSELGTAFLDELADFIMRSPITTVRRQIPPTEVTK